MALTTERLSRLRQRLLEQREKVMEEIKTLAKDAAKSPREAAGDISAYATHMADMATDTYERERSIDLVSAEERRLDQIQKALRRMEEDSYGLCEACNRDIGLSRLESVPYASLCIACQRSKEQQGKP